MVRHVMTWWLTWQRRHIRQQYRRTSFISVFFCPASKCMRVCHWSSSLLHAERWECRHLLSKSSNSLRCQIWSGFAKLFWSFFVTHSPFSVSYQYVQARLLHISLSRAVSMVNSTSHPMRHLTHWFYLLCFLFLFRVMSCEASTRILPLIYCRRSTRRSHSGSLTFVSRCPLL